jgi:hypothetical protein
MVKLTVDETPSAQLVAEALKETSVTDGRGRMITLKKPGVLAQFQIVKVMGETAKNEVYMAMIMPLLFISDIDGDAVHFPRTELEVDALIQRLDEDGVAAVMLKVQEVWGAPDPEKAKADLKN